MIDPHTISLMQSVHELKEQIELMTLDEFEEFLGKLSPAESRWISELLTSYETEIDEEDLEAFLEDI